MSVKNNIRLIGNLGKDAEVTAFKNGRAVVTTVLATSKSLGKDDNGEYKEKTQWHTLKFFRNSEESAQKTADKLTKGLKIAILGELDYNSYEDENQKPHTVAYIDVESWEKE